MDSESSPTPSRRTAQIVRATRETDIRLALNLDGQGRAGVETGVGFFDHMLDALARHGLFDLEVTCRGDLHVDDHHTVEDVGICFGQALHAALGDKRGIRRYGHCVLPMDETLVTVAVDLGGRPHWSWKVTMPTPKIGHFDSELVAEFWRAVSINGQMNFHAILNDGGNCHHVVEAVFKAAAQALRDATAIDPRRHDVPSTKGTLTQ